MRLCRVWYALAFASQDKTLCMYVFENAQKESYAVEIDTASESSSFVDTEGANTEMVFVNDNHCEIQTFADKNRIVAVMVTAYGTVKVSGQISYDQVIHVLEYIH